MGHKRDIPHLGWSSHVYPLDAADFAQVPDYAGPAIPSTALPDDAIILYIRPDGPDAVLRGRAAIDAALRADASAVVPVRIVFKPSVAKWNLAASIVRVLRNRYRFHGTGRYHIATTAVRALGLERTIRTLDNPQKRGKTDRLAKMHKLEESLRTHGYDDARPINVMLCRTWGREDSIRQGHHRVSACLACGVPKMCVEFSAAGALPQAFGRPAAILPPPRASDGPVNVLCMKWGHKNYPAYYVNRLYAGVKAHLPRPFRFVCMTDDPTGVRPEVECVDFPPNPDVKGRKWPNVHAKLLVFRKGFANLEGPTLFLDIDLIVLNDLGRFFDYRPGDFCIIHNWIERRKLLFRRRPAIGNSSCFRFDAGTDAAHRVYEAFLRDKDDPALDAYFRKGSQKYQTRAMREAGRVSWWPEAWVCSFKRQCIPLWPLNLLVAPRPPKTASVIAFHGSPDIPEAITGFREHKGHKVPPHLTCRPAPWVKDLWEGGEA